MPLVTNFYKGNHLPKCSEFSVAAILQQTRRPNIDLAMKTSIVHLSNAKVINETVVRLDL